MTARHDRITHVQSPSLYEAKLLQLTGRTSDDRSNLKSVGVISNTVARFLSRKGLDPINHRLGQSKTKGYRIPMYDLDDLTWHHLRK